MNGINIAEACHVVNALPAVSISGGKTTVPFHMKTAAHASIILSFGARGAANPTSFILQQASDEAGDSAAALPFRFYYQKVAGAGNDVLVGPKFAASTGITATLPVGDPLPTSVASLVWVIEIDAAELETALAAVGPITELPYLQLVIADGGNVTIASCVVILSGQRYQAVGTPTVTA